MVAVLGMHRSGTSAVTELLGLAGLVSADPDGLYEPGGANPHGSQESRVLTTFNEGLLRTLGGSWHAPPTLPPGWDASSELDHLRAQAAEHFAAQMPSRSWVWKDPRLCLVLPFWERVLTEQPVIVLVRRHPQDVAKSLSRRNSFPVSLGLALWERYLRTALAVCRGHRVLAVSYDRVLDDPLAVVDQTRTVLAGFGVQLDAAAEPETIRDAVDPRLRHHNAKDARLSPAQQALWNALSGLDDASAPFGGIDLGPETETTESILAGPRPLRTKPSRVRKLASRAKRRWTR
jgi:hypothetical protein